MVLYDTIDAAKWNECPVKFRVLLCEELSQGYLKNTLQIIGLYRYKYWERKEQSTIRYFREEMKRKLSITDWTVNRNIMPYVFNPFASKEDKIDQVNECHELWKSRQEAWTMELIGSI